VYIVNYVLLAGCNIYYYIASSIRTHDSIIVKCNHWSKVLFDH